ncbi:MAG: hypothetical protein ACE5GJ_00825 [Gemmatimonadota bacterium]
MAARIASLTRTREDAMSLAAYKLIHFLGIFTVVTALSTALARASLTDGEDPWRKRVGMLHGIGLFLILLGGFGMMSRLNIPHVSIYPGWIWVKLVIWAVLAGGIVVARRSPAWSVRFLILLPFLGALAGFLGYTKPF